MEDNEESDDSISVWWIVVSLVISIVLARFAKGSFCTYLYTTMIWVYVSILFKQKYFKSMQQGPRKMTCYIIVGLIGWSVGVALVWRSRHRSLFFEVSKREYYRMEPNVALSHRI